MNTEQELRPCPFCGTSNKLKVTPYRADDDGGEPFDWGFTVICSALGLSHAPNRGCGASGAWGETEAEAIAAWNRRAPAVAAGGVTEEMVEAAARAIYAIEPYGSSIIGDVDWDEIDRYPQAELLRERAIACAREALTAALAVGDEGIREGVTGTGSVDVLRELAREEVALGYADHAKWLRYAANRLSSFDALRIAAALAGPTPPSRGEGV